MELFAPNIEIVDNLILVREMTDSGPEKVGALYVPTSEKEQKVKQVAILCGPNVKFAKPGDLLILGKHAGIHFPFKGVNYKILNEDEDVLGRINPEPQE